MIIGTDCYHSLFSVLCLTKCVCIRTYLNYNNSFYYLNLFRYHYTYIVQNKDKTIYVKNQQKHKSTCVNNQQKKSATRIKQHVPTISNKGKTTCAHKEK
jgi:hypothetical protein